MATQASNNRIPTGKELLLQAAKTLYPPQLRTAVEGVALGVMAGHALHAHDRRFVKLPQQQRKVEYASRLGGRRRLGFVALTCVVIPVAEEVGFRGLAREFHVQQQQNPHSPASIATRTVVNAVLFSGAHIEYTRSLRFNLHLFRANMVAGIVFCSLAEFSQNLVGCTVAHSWVNYLSIKRK